MGEDGKKPAPKGILPGTVLKLKAVPSQGTGSFSWKSKDKAIKIENAGSQVVSLSVIRSNRIIREQGELWTAQALAKLGDSLTEDHLIKLYKQEKGEGRKRDYAWMLGFVATPKTILTLAYPTEPVLWKPNGTPTDDRYYETIEEWASSKLGVAWDAPRPPFLYEMDVPTPAQGR